MIGEMIGEHKSWHRTPYFHCLVYVLCYFRDKLMLILERNGLDTISTIEMVLVKEW